MLGQDGGDIGKRAFPTFRRDVWAAPAPMVTAAAPTIHISRSPEGVVTLSAPFTAGSQLALDLRVDTLVRDVMVDGRPLAILSKPGQWTHLRWQGGGDQVSVSFRPSGPGTMEARYAQFTTGWPAQAKPWPPMPANVMAWDLAGSTVVTGAVRSGW